MGMAASHGPDVATLHCATPLLLQYTSVLRSPLAILAVAAPTTTKQLPKERGARVRGIYTACVNGRSSRRSQALRPSLRRTILLFAILLGATVLRGIFLSIRLGRVLLGRLLSRLSGLGLRRRAPTLVVVRKRLEQLLLPLAERPAG